MIPGPTPVPEKVLKSLSKHPIGHRSPEFQEIVKTTDHLLKWLHQTKGDVLTSDASEVLQRLGQLYHEIGLS